MRLYKGKEEEEQQQQQQQQQEKRKRNNNSNNNEVNNNNKVLYGDVASYVPKLTAFYSIPQHLNEEEESKVTCSGK